MAKEVEDPGPEFKSKRYACMQWPFLRLRGKVQFDKGFFTAQTPEQVEIVETNQAYGVHIHPIKWEPQPVPTKPGKVEELIESEIANALAEKQPRVRRGAIGTR